jgi:rhodanese-related sulfurtransferase
MIEFMKGLLNGVTEALLMFYDDHRLAVASPQCHHVAEGICGDERLIAHLQHTWPSLVWHHDDPFTMQRPRRYGTVVLGADLTGATPSEHHRSLVHNAVQHLLPGGLLITGFQASSPTTGLSSDDYEALCAECDLTAISRHAEGSSVVMVHRRTDRFTIHDAVYEARQTFRRLTSHELAAQLCQPDAPLVVDTRTQTDRARFGVIAGSIHVPRTVLEWHLDPANGYRHPMATSLHQPMVVVCNRGYSSSLGAASLVRLGFTAVADLIGGVHAWVAQGYPVQAADHDHLDW